MGRMLSAFTAGMIFSLGLIISGMADPAKVLGFFDVLGVWDPTLAFVMGGGLTVSATGYRWCMAQSAPLCAGLRQLPSRTDLDARLFLGAALFGLGWGMVGYCPAPALVSGFAVSSQALLFCAAMAVGMAAWALVERLSQSTASNKIRVNA